MRLLPRIPAAVRRRRPADAAVETLSSFDPPGGFDGFHEFTALPDGDGSVLRHLIAMRVHGKARLTWPLLYRPLHDALLEDLLDRAEENLTGEVARPARWSLPVRLLRGLRSR
ncbi:hypothetical protein ACFS2C_09585 [Prauserella oleivorans]|uniref:DUF2867 domain-containing protein n=1 Tax=Prauserella oleivorans TaxID=1478153 RepID=A0ABW5W6Q0_9PSEU